jgi:hypothetical protein
MDWAEKRGRQWLIWSVYGPQDAVFTLERLALVVAAILTFRDTPAGVKWPAKYRTDDADGVLTLTIDLIAHPSPVCGLPLGQSNPHPTHPRSNVIPHLRFVSSVKTLSASQPSP